MILPMLISVPHAGLDVPAELKEINLLTPEQIVQDGDEGACDIFGISDEVTGFVTSDVARAYIDMNRPEDDRSSDGVVKTETIYKVPIYREPLTEEQVGMLLDRYYRPYHFQLTRLSDTAVLGIDCHTMAAEAPPICPDAGTARPLICLSNGDGSCSQDWLESMAGRLTESFQCEVSLNEPFKGGYIIRSHAAELPWMQLEISRAPFMSLEEKRSNFRQAFNQWFRSVR